MPSTQGFAKYNSGKLVGTFDVDGRPRYLAVDVRPPNQLFECDNVTLIYDNVAQLSGDCKWTGTAGSDDLQMDFGGGVSVVGPLATPRSSIRIRGAGTWSTVKPTLSPDLADNIQRNPVNPLPLHNTLPDVAEIARERELLESKVPIIAIFGQSGTGKSTFINLIASEQQKVGKSLQSCTRDVRVIDAKIGGQRVVVIDTPGIDDTRIGVKETEVLTRIANHLGDMGRRNVWVTGVLFLHRINDNRFSHTAQRISIMLKNLCGDTAMSHLMLCTTMWDTVPDEEGYERFDELCETGAWKEMISKGAGTAMISSMNSNAKAEAENIVNQLIKNAAPVEVAIQDEMVNQAKKPAETSAGKALDEAQENQAESDRMTKEVYETLKKEREVKASKELQKLMRMRREEMRTRKQEAREKKKRANEEVEALKARARQLRQERERAERAIKELQARTRREAVIEAAKAREVMSAQLREINAVRKQVTASAGNPRRGLFRSFNRRTPRS